MLSDLPLIFYMQSAEVSIFCSDTLTDVRSWRHCQAIMHCCLTGERQNCHLSRNPSMMESLDRCSKFSV